MTTLLASIAEAGNYIEVMAYRNTGEWEVKIQRGDKTFAFFPHNCNDLIYRGSLFAYDLSNNASIVVGAIKALIAMSMRIYPDDLEATPAEGQAETARPELSGG